MQYYYCSTIGTEAATCVNVRCEVLTEVTVKSIVIWDNAM